MGTSRSGYRSLSRRRALGWMGLLSAGALVAACSGLPGVSSNEATPSHSPVGGAVPAPAQTAVLPLAALPTPKPGQAVVHYWHNLGSGVSADVHAQQIRDFLQARPNFAVDARYVPTANGVQYPDQLKAAISGGSPPDAAHFDRFLVTSWAARGLLTELTDRARSDGVSADQFIAEGWLEATWKGRVYAVPFDTDLRALYVNTAHLSDAGLDPGRLPTTIAELDALAAKLTKPDASGYTRLGFLPWADEGYLYTWGWVFGGEFYDPQKDVITLDHPGIVAALKWMVSYTKTYPVDTLDRFASGFGANAKDPFVAGEVSQIAGGDWQVAIDNHFMPEAARDHWDIVPFPRAPGGPPKVTWGGGWSTILPHGSHELDGGWALAKYLGTDAAALYAVETTHIPVYLPAYADLEKNQAKFDPRWVKFWPLRSVARYRPNLPVAQELANALTQALDLARHGKEAPEAVLQRLDKQVNDAYAQFKSG